jgi:7-cyano-7-deazaguanine synthase in queuosine biosynthesis
MNNDLFLCDTSIMPPLEPDLIWDKQINLNRVGRHANLNLRIDNITNPILSDFAPIANDLVQIASYIYGGDQFISRGGPADVYGHKWQRHLHYVIPVSDPSFWGRPEIYEPLIETLNFLTGDIYNFTFVLAIPELRQLTFNSPEMCISSDGADSIVLFSGGSDSLCALIEQVVDNGRKPILVSHRSAPFLNSRQKNLTKILRSRIQSWSFPHISVWVHLQDEEAKEYTQRSRSFLYASLATVVAYQTGINNIILSDNGIVSLNIRKNGQLIGTYASRTTHPKFLYSFQKLIQVIFQKDITIKNTLAFRTRAETLDILKKHSCSDLLQETVSCAHSRQPNATPHCGVCSQCVDRRFGSIAADLEEHDLPERYDVDIFTDELKEGLDRTQVESYVRFARKIEELSDDGLFNEFPELFDCIIPSDVEQGNVAEKYIDLLRRHAKEVRFVTERKMKEHFPKFYEANLPDSCLLRLISSGHHKTDQVQLFAERIESLFLESLPLVFQSKEPENEHEVQDAGEAIIKAKQEEFDRELPLLPFGGVTTKPDFSTSENPFYFIEMKYLKSREYYNRIITEITSRITVYGTQKAFAHFIVYDPKHIILHETQFREDIEKNGYVKVTIVR